MIHPEIKKKMTDALKKILEESIEGLSIEIPLSVSCEEGGRCLKLSFEFESYYCPPKMPEHIKGCK